MVIDKGTVDNGLAYAVEAVPHDAKGIAACGCLHLRGGNRVADKGVAIEQQAVLGLGVAQQPVAAPGAGFDLIAVMGDQTVAHKAGADGKERRAVSKLRHRQIVGEDAVGKRTVAALGGHNIAGAAIVYLTPLSVGQLKAAGEAGVVDLIVAALPEEDHIATVVKRA